MNPATPPGEIPPLRRRGFRDAPGQQVAGYGTQFAAAADPLNEMRIVTESGLPGGGGLRPAHEPPAESPRGSCSSRTMKPGGQMQRTLTDDGGGGGAAALLSSLQHESAALAAAEEEDAMLLEWQRQQSAARCAYYAARAQQRCGLSQSAADGAAAEAAEGIFQLGPLDPPDSPTTAVGSALRPQLLRGFPPGFPPASVVAAPPTWGLDSAALPLPPLPLQRPHSPLPHVVSCGDVPSAALAGLPHESLRSPALPLINSCSDDRSMAGCFRAAGSSYGLAPPPSSLDCSGGGALRPAAVAAATTECMSQAAVVPALPPPAPPPLRARPATKALPAPRIVVPAAAPLSGATPLPPLAPLRPRAEPPLATNGGGAVDARAMPAAAATTMPSSATLLPALPWEGNGRATDDIGGSAASISSTGRGQARPQMAAAPLFGYAALPPHQQQQLLQQYERHELLPAPLAQQQQPTHPRLSSAGGRGSGGEDTTTGGGTTSGGSSSLAAAAAAALPQSSSKSPSWQAAEGVAAAGLSPTKTENEEMPPACWMPRAGYYNGAHRRNANDYSEEEMPAAFATMTRMSDSSHNNSPRSPTPCAGAAPSLLWHPLPLESQSIPQPAAAYSTAGGGPAQLPAVAAPEAEGHGYFSDGLFGIAAASRRAAAAPGAAHASASAAETEAHEEENELEQRFVDALRRAACRAGTLGEKGLTDRRGEGK